MYSPNYIGKIAIKEKSINNKKILKEIYQINKILILINQKITTKSLRKIAISVINGHQLSCTLSVSSIKKLSITNRDPNNQQLVFWTFD
jgi:hypothetical protein